MPSSLYWPKATFWNEWISKVFIREMLCYSRKRLWTQVALVSSSVKKGLIISTSQDIYFKVKNEKTYSRDVPGICQYLVRDSFIGLVYAVKAEQMILPIT